MKLNENRQFSPSKKGKRIPTKPLYGHFIKCFVVVGSVFFSFSVL